MPVHHPYEWQEKRRLTTSLYARRLGRRGYFVSDASCGLLRRIGAGKTRLTGLAAAFAPRSPGTGLSGGGFPFFRPPLLHIRRAGSNINL